MKKTLLVAGILLLTSCSTIAKKAYGIKNPKLENKETLNNYMNSIDLNTQNSLIVNNKKYYNEVLKDFGNSIPEAILFDKNGNQVKYKKTSQDCNAGLFVTIPTLTTFSSLEKKQGKNLQEFANQLMELNSSKLISNFPEADYYLFLNWAKFMGKLNKDHVKEWEDLANKNTNTKILVYKVNMDFQDSWGLNEKDLKMKPK